jgi:hypothetical protein
MWCPDIISRWKSPSSFSTGQNPPVEILQLHICSVLGYVIHIYFAMWDTSISIVITCYSVIPHIIVKIKGGQLRCRIHMSFTVTEYYNKNKTHSVLLQEWVHISSHVNLFQYKTPVRPTILVICNGLILQVWFPPFFLALVVLYLFHYVVVRILNSL